MIIAKTENDFNYLPFSSTKVNTSTISKLVVKDQQFGISMHLFMGNEIFTGRVKESIFQL